MMTSEASLAISYGLIYACTIVVLVFILCYGTLARWEKTNIGRHMMVFSLATFFALLQISVSVYTGGYPGQDIIRPLTYLGFMGVWVWRIGLFLREHVLHRRQLLHDEVMRAMAESKRE